MILTLPNGISHVELRIVTADGVPPIVNVFHPQPDPVPGERPAPPSAPRLRRRSPWRRPLIVAGGFAVLTVAVLATSVVVVRSRTMPSTVLHPSDAAARWVLPHFDPADPAVPAPRIAHPLDPRPTPPMPKMPSGFARELARPPVVSPPPRSAPPRAVAPSATPDAPAHAGNPFGLE